MERGQERYATCVSCHGAEGEGSGIFPKIAGQSAEYIAERLSQYRAGETVGPNTPLMAPHASALSDEAIADLAVYVATLGEPADDPAVEDEAAVEDEPAPEAEPVAAGDAERGQQRYATCVSCHGPEGQGMGIFPKIAGQSAEYIAERLSQYRAGETVGPNTPLMAPHASALSDEAIADLAAYVASF
ncbi:c-type cytochrome [Thioalkalivibrio paradoxus]|uniref:c-type cytochrome n=1 Tax=Thioalkalivibrio paradoxus TaxID=108010 RepID=UPI0038CD1423